MYTEMQPFHSECPLPDGMHGIAQIRGGLQAAFCRFGKSVYLKDPEGKEGSALLRLKAFRELVEGVCCCREAKEKVCDNCPVTDEAFDESLATSC
jgi:hypothetical protein